LFVVNRDPVEKKWGSGIQVKRGKIELMGQEVVTQGFTQAKGMGKGGKAPPMTPENIKQLTLRRKNIEEKGTGRKVRANCKTKQQVPQEGK